MDDLQPLSAAEGGPVVWNAVFAEDADDANSELMIKIPDYDDDQQFGPVRFVPQPLTTGGILLPTRGDWCLVTFDEDDNAQLVTWKGQDPTA
jgi:hypothetical protein